MAPVSPAVDHLPPAASMVASSLNEKPQLVKDLAAQDISCIPDSFILPEHERPYTAIRTEEVKLPVIDFSDFHGEGRAKVLKEIAEACEDWGFFQAVNHGVDISTIQDMWTVAREFFDMPLEDKLKYYTDDVTKPTRLGTSYNPTKESKLHWRDYFHQICNPLPDVIETWPNKPASYREVALKYSQAMKSLAEKLSVALGESLGLHANAFQETFKAPDQHLMLNLYPPCPTPDLTYGLASHSDPGGVTILLQDEVEGLQVFHKGDWITVKPITNAFVINLGDAVQVFSNGRFKSVNHRALVNVKQRMSIPYFFDPAKEVTLSPFESLLDENHPPLYREIVFEDHLLGCTSRSLVGKYAVDYLKLTDDQE